MRVLLLSICCLFLCLSCKNQAQKSDGEKLLEFSRTACLGSCPAYQVQVYTNGKVSYNGEAHVPLVGEKNFQLSDEDMANLRSLLDDRSVRMYKSSYYDDSINDLPTTYITYYYDGGKKEIMDYYGAPESLRELEKNIEQIIFSYLP